MDEQGKQLCAVAIQLAMLMGKMLAQSQEHHVAESKSSECIRQDRSWPQQRLLAAEGHVFAVPA
jgi:hypothetical protein